ncbi:HTH-type transcriptional regulator LutR [Pelagimonas phthalicica]|uniref:HTH-type transcriptional regulator LutR n=1 Tax=Pelagimonas phthalicica TaxID=1037362 RepID=A0A238JC09_9RHOB|nr:transcriptional regulator NanR [Pelagimonas phthalicica]TDS93566.1 GntR family transcriptional regulator [Pelagimonas phthalicica]SMX27913.1 HTH-type transcriptional regulator LutR [Pelagimonas phthalicica]
MAKNPTTPSGFDVAPITRQKLSDQVFDRLWEMIVSGDLKPGDIIPSERKLMEKFGVGRPAVREALQMLANKGVITISHGERTRVNEFSANIALDQVDDIAKLLLSAEPSNLEHLKQVRKILEAGLVRVAAANCTEDDIRTLRDLVDVQRRQTKNQKGFIETDISFHTAIANATRNPLLQAVTHAMLTWLFEYYKPLLHWSGRENTTLMEHEKLVDFLEAGDADSAAALMREHLDRSDPLYTNTLT